MNSYPAFWCRFFLVVGVLKKQCEKYYITIYCEIIFNIVIALMFYNENILY